MKKTGFTLVELLGVIVILGLLAFLLFPSMINVFTESEDGITEAEKKMVISGARDYVSDNVEYYPNISSSEYCFYISSLVDKGYVKLDENSDLLDYYVIAKADGKKFDYDVVDSCDDIIAKVQSQLDEEPDDSIFEDEKGNIRYRGKTPKNYVRFNGELWRIIGIIDGKLKIIRDKSIGNLEWDQTNTYGENDWTNADLMKLMNPGYESVAVGGSLYWNSLNGTCYRSETNNSNGPSVLDGHDPITCNFDGLNGNPKGLGTEAKNMIVKTTWNLGGWNTAYITAPEIYQKERGTIVYEGRPTVWEGYVGLMYPSDYGYAASKKCLSKNLSSYTDSECTSTNWLYNGSEYEWLQTPYTERSFTLWDIYANGLVGNSSFAYYPKAVRPVVYLKASVKITGGTGTSTDPYKLSL